MALYLIFLYLLLVPAFLFPGAAGDKCANGGKLLCNHLLKMLRCTLLCLVSVHTVCCVLSVSFLFRVEIHAMFSCRVLLCYPYVPPIKYLVVHSCRLDTHVARSLVVMSVSLLVLLQACNRETSDGCVIFAKCALSMCVKEIRAGTLFSEVQITEANRCIYTQKEKGRYISLSGMLVITMFFPLVFVTLMLYLRAQVGFSIAGEMIKVCLFS